MTSTPITAASHTGYCTSQATRNASGVKPPIAVMTVPITASTNNVAEKPPMFTMLCATPRLRRGLEVRAPQIVLPTVLRVRDSTGPARA